jgi:hypothetical protein
MLQIIRKRKKDQFKKASNFAPQKIANAAASKK